MSMEGRTLVFAFEPPSCRDLAARLVPKDSHYVPLSSKESRIREFVRTLSPHYPAIIGIGLSRQLRAAYRFEPRFVNRFRNKPIEVSGPEFLPQGISSGSTGASQVTWLYCNLVSYLIHMKLQAERSDVRFYFIHINPRYAPVENIADLLSGAFQQMQIQVG